jgi:hypothetical protein
MDEPRESVFGRRLGDGSGRIDMQRPETLSAKRLEHANQIDSEIRPSQRVGDLCAVMNIALNQLDLAHLAGHQQEWGKIGVAHGHADPIPGFRQGPDHMSADKARSTENCDQLWHALTFP